MIRRFVSVFLVVYFGQLVSTQTTKSCPKTCPTGWTTFPNSGNDHCYLLPPNPVKASFLTDFWSMQTYCVLREPSSYVATVNSVTEENAGTVPTKTYLNQYASSLGTYWIWLGGFFKSGSWYWLDGTKFEYNRVVTNSSDPPKNGSCLYIDPKSANGTWSYRSCDDTSGAAACEMSPTADCNATTPASTTSPTKSTPAYKAPDCKTSAWADFVRHASPGYMATEEFQRLFNMTIASCSTACLYDESCLSFDFNKVKGDCRLLETISQVKCSFTNDPPGQWQHYDLMRSSL